MYVYGGVLKTFTFSSHNYFFLFFLYNNEMVTEQAVVLMVWLCLTLQV